MSRHRYSVAFVALALASCGAGIVGGVLASRDGDEPPPVAPAEPAVTLSIDRGPLDIAPGERYEGAAVLSNIAIPPGSEVEVDLALPPQGASTDEIVERQPEVVIDTSAGGTIRWRLSTTAIRAAFPDPTAQDVPVKVRFAALRDGVRTALGEGVFTLLRKPIARIANPKERTVRIGGGLLALKVTPLLGDELQVEIRTAPNRVRAASIDTRTDDEALGTTSLVIAVPPGDTPEELEAVIIDREAGRSTPVRTVFYAPDLIAVAERSGSTDGDDVISLIGAGLIPTRFDANGTPFVDPTRVEVVLSRGGHEFVVDSRSFLNLQSTPNALTFRSPPSPDGHPGSVTIEVRVRVDTSSGGEFVVTDSEKSLFAYTAASPSFEPRGLTLDGLPIGVAFGRLTEVPTIPGPADAAAVFMSLIDNVGLVRVLSANGHGMFQRIGPFVPTGEPGVAELLRPTDVCVGDFVGDAFLDVIVANLGTPEVAPIVSLLENDATRRGILGGFTPSIVVSGEVPRHAFAARFDGDARHDVMIAAFADTAIVESSRGFVPRWVDDVYPAAFEPGQHLVAQPMDLDRDGADDACFVVTTFDGRRMLTILHNRPGGFVAQAPLDLTPMLGGFQILAAADVGDGVLRRIAFALGPLDIGTPGRLLRLSFDAQWNLVDSASTDLAPSPAGPQFQVMCALGADLDGDGAFELALGSESTGIRIYDARGSGFTLLREVATFDGEPIGRVLALDWAPVSATRRALIARHQQTVQLGGEVRLTTLLGAPGSTALAGPKSKRELSHTAMQVLAPGTAGGDVVAVYADGIEPFVSDVFGELTSAGIVPINGMFAATAARVPFGSDALIAYMRSDGRVAVLLPGASAPLVAPEPLIPIERLGLVTVLNASRLRSGDVDGDGVVDLVALVVYRDDTIPPPARFASLVALRGTPGAEFPFSGFDRATALDVAVDGAESIALGNFARDEGTIVQEVAVVDPTSGVRFYRYDRALARMVAIDTADGAPFLAAARSPVVVAPVDFDLDLVDDLAVLSLGRSQVMFYAQQEPRFGTVNPAGFALIEEQAIPSGTRAQLDAVDVDGDAIQDFVVSVIESLGRPQVGVILWDGAGRVRRAFPLPAERLGFASNAPSESRAFSLSIGDVNRDGVADLVCGWGAGVAPAPVQPSSMHVLFGSRR